MKARPGRRVISATDAAKNFGTLIERVRTDRAEYIVERSGTPAVRIVPAGPHRCSVADLVDFFKSHKRPEEGYLKAVEAGIAALNAPVVPEDRWER